MQKVFKILFITIFTIFVSTNLYSQTCKSYITNEWQDSRYTDNGDGTITDKTTKLMWKKCSEGQSSFDCSNGSASNYNWKNALSLNNSIFAGHSDWRLPNIKELGSLVSFNCYNPSINKTMFPNTPDSFFLSSSSISNKHNYIWRISFKYGYDNDKERNLSSKVRLVRSGE
jgi:hypothetical protein